MLKDVRFGAKMTRKSSNSAVYISHENTHGVRAGAAEIACNVSEQHRVVSGSTRCAIHRGEIW